MAQYTLKNDLVTVVIDEHASEIHSFRDNQTGIEYMWQGDPKYWTGRNPTLFPIVGSTWDKKLHIHGKEYDIGNHGFARHSDFICMEHDDAHLVMELTDNEETRKQYPFAFQMDIHYTLKGRELQIQYEISNTNDEDMPFSFGLHPAFNCPLDPKKKFEDCKISFNAPENVSLLNGQMADTKDIPLNRDDLKKTIIIASPKSTEVSLGDEEHSVTLHYEGYEWIAFWSPEAPFVCLEPWHGHGDFSKVEVPFEQREGTVILAPHTKWTSDYAIRVK
ncbi:MAG: aldose 1-epimerase family protein [Erysipelotrichaceae bacterium]|jgi:galactose mutarotase-like enzyme|nr:aldose 1-epimerase family protein [Erysipelotrichaceae bacterium]